MNIAISSLIYSEAPNQAANALDLRNLWFSNANLEAKDMFESTVEKNIQH